MDAILIEGLVLTCIVGLRPHERVRKQSVVLDVELGLDLMPAGRSGRIVHTCDYDRVADSVRALLCFREYHLVEVATEELAAMLFGLHPALERARIQLTKPAALAGRARSAAVRIERARADFPRQWLTRAGRRVAVLFETREAGLYTITLERGAVLDADLGIAARAQGRRAAAWVVGGTLGVRGAELAPGAGVELDAAPITNSREDPATLFVCTTPGLDLPALGFVGSTEP